MQSLALQRVRFLDEITENVLRKYKVFLEEKGFAGKTIDTRIGVVYLMLKKNKVEARLPKDEMPIIEEEPAVPYGEEELKKLFASMTDEDRIRYKFFLGTACREREVTYASWQDVDWTKKEFHVRSKPEVGFTVKNHESRSVPIPDNLVTALKDRRKNPQHARWIFVNRDGNPEGHFLKKLKRIALHAGLNCGHCRTTMTKGKYDRKREVEITCATDPGCEHIYLHRLRKTCATRWMKGGDRHAMLQSWLGHKELETTMKYLGVMDSNKLRANVNQAFSDWSRCLPVILPAPLRCLRDPAWQLLAPGEHFVNVGVEIPAIDKPPLPEVPGSNGSFLDQCFDERVRPSCVLSSSGDIK